MSEMDDEIQAVKIRHLGQCPQEKGHSEMFFPGFMIGVGVCMVILIIGASVAPDRQKEAIQRGYATRDPITMEFKWR